MGIRCLSRAASEKKAASSVLSTVPDLSHVLAIHQQQYSSLTFHRKKIGMASRFFKKVRWIEQIHKAPDTISKFSSHSECCSELSTEPSEWHGSPTRLHARINSHAHSALLVQSPLHSTKGRGLHMPL